MVWHGEKQFSSLTMGEQQKERDKVNSGYCSEYFSDIIRERNLSDKKENDK